MTTRQEMIQEAKSLNKHLTDEYLNDKSDSTIFSFTHPLYREKYHKKVFDN